MVNFMVQSERGDAMATLAKHAAHDADAARAELITRRAACADDVAWRVGGTDVRHRVARSGGIRSHGTVIDVDVYTDGIASRRYTIDVTTYAGNGTSLGRGRVIR